MPEQAGVGNRSRNGFDSSAERCGKGCVCAGNARSATAGSLRGAPSSLRMVRSCVQAARAAGAGGSDARPRLWAQVPPTQLSSLVQAYTQP